MRGRAAAAVAGGFVLAAFVAAVAYRAAYTWRPEIPRVWDEAALDGWATPLAGLGKAPTHLSAAEYYSIPEENLRSYPLYMPDREPPGYFERLQNLGPQPLIEPEKLVTQADWIAAGERVFLDSVVLKTLDPQVIAMARSEEAMRARGTGPLPNGTINGLRWVPTKDGLAVGLTNCSACHLLYLPDDTPVPGASSFAMPRTRCPASRRSRSRARSASRRIRPTARRGRTIRPASGCGTSLRPSSTRTSAPRSAAAASRAGTAACSIPRRFRI
jgi:hypothetical protein